MGVDKVRPQTLSSWIGGKHEPYREVASRELCLIEGASPECYLSSLTISQINSKNTGQSRLLEEDD